MVRLNYAAALYNHREHSLAAKQFTHFEGIIKNKGVQQFDPEVCVSVHVYVCIDYQTSSIIIPTRK